MSNRNFTVDAGKIALPLVQKDLYALRHIFFRKEAGLHPDI
jgi:hypothetical protein